MTLHITRAPVCCHKAVAFLMAEPGEDWEQVKFPHGSAADAESTLPHITIPSSMLIPLDMEPKQLSLVIDYDRVSGCRFLK